MSDDTPQFLAYRIAVAAKILGVSKSQLYVLINKGYLEKIRIEGIALVTHASMQQLIDQRRPGGDPAPNDAKKRR